MEVALSLLHAGLVLAHTGQEQQLTPQHPLCHRARVCPRLPVDEVLQQPDEEGLGTKYRDTCVPTGFLKFIAQPTPQVRGTTF